MNKLLLFISGRRGQWKRLKAIFGKEEQNASVLWLHCASLGEFEQGRPVLEAYRTRYPDHKILLTFFSPSGYEVRKNTPLADYVFYLPVDSPRNARRFLNLVRPSAAVFVKYEFWYFYLAQLKKREVPTYL
ncbi:MAG: glycosyltransferase N-terminal domain-containing protein, partial [Bacteroidales bacterium]